METLKKCPICGKEVKIKGGCEEWIPSFYDPDSGGDPYSIDCECGIGFSVGYCEVDEIIKAWNKRQ